MSLWLLFPSPVDVELLGQGWVTAQPSLSLPAPDSSAWSSAGLGQGTGASLLSGAAGAASALLCLSKHLVWDRGAGLESPCSSSRALGEEPGDKGAAGGWKRTFLQEPCAGEGHREGRGGSNGIPWGQRDPCAWAVLALALMGAVLALMGAVLTLVVPRLSWQHS